MIRSRLVAPPAEQVSEDASDGGDARGEQEKHATMDETKHYVLPAGAGRTGGSRAGSIASRVAASLVVLAVMGLAAAMDLALAGEAYVFSVRLEGEPEVGCIVTTPDGACNGDRIRGTLVPDGEPSLNGTFSFAPPGIRDKKRQPLGRVGRGRIAASFVPASNTDARHCVLRGRLGIQGVALPGGRGTRRFYTGTFDGRGKCDGRRVRVRAIWSGGVGAESGPIMFDFERFQGRMAGTLWYTGPAVR